MGEAYTGRANNRGRSFEGRGEGPKRINQLQLLRLLHGDQTRNTFEIEFALLRLKYLLQYSLYFWVQIYII